MLKIDKLPPVGHIGIVVPDIEKAIEELKDVYGLEGLNISNVYDFVPMRIWAWGKEIDGCHIKIAMVDWINGLKMEILQPVHGDIEHARFVKETGGGLHHTAYYVDDYEAYREFIIGLGGQVIFESETEDAKGYRRCCYAKFEETQNIVEVLENARIRK